MESPQARRLMPESRRGITSAPGELSRQETRRRPWFVGERLAGWKAPKLAKGEGCCCQAAPELKAGPAGQAGSPKKLHCGGGVGGIGGRPKPFAGIPPPARGAAGGPIRGAGEAAASASSSPRAPVIAVSVSRRWRLPTCRMRGECTQGSSSEDRENDIARERSKGSIGAMGRSMSATWRSSAMTSGRGPSSSSWALLRRGDDRNRPPLLEPRTMGSDA
mmetsp:Transcript_84670/g.238196  ORF Transcript_84670/g.238196 Transcript_84670/m.238196 type:complete len:219 (-) Transcript_84670:2-658(-)